MSWPYLVRLDTADHAANDPADTLAKRVIASNLDHLANSHGQVLVNWTSADGSGVQRTGASLINVWNSALFPLKIRPDGSAFPLRIRVRGRRASGSSDVTFRVGLREVGHPFATFTTSSSTSAWLTPTNTFSPTTPNLLNINAGRSASFFENVSGPSTLGGAQVSHREVMTNIYVTALIDSSDTAELTGLHVAEVIGA